jgi:pilus assembly protein CpaC
MHPKRNTRRLLTWSLVLIAGLAVTVGYGQQPKQPAVLPTGEVQVDKTGALIVPLGGLVTYDPKLDPKTDVLTDVIVAREDILQVRPDPMNPSKLLLTGKAPGLTQLTLVLKDKPKIVKDVIVQPDLNLLRALIRRTLPTASVDVQPGVGNIVILSGYVTSPQDVDVLTRLAITAAGNQNNIVNAVQVGGGQQVQIDVVIALVNRSLARDRGFDFAIRGGSVRFDSLVSGLIGTRLAATPVATGGNMLLQAGTVPDQFFGALQALRIEGVTKFLAEPRVVTQTGRPAFFRVGGQQAIISGTSGITGPGVQLVPFGTELEVVPIVYGNGMIWLEINPRITSVNANLGITVGGATSPGFNEQQVRTAVMLQSGQTYAVGGLIQNTVTASANKIPVLGELPYIGAAFSRVQHQQTETELVILVTPRLVAPMNCDQVPHRLPGQETRNPDDYELFLESILEAPRGQRKVWNNRCYNAPWKCGPTAAIFPCVGNLCTGGPQGTCSTGGCGPAAGLSPMTAPLGAPPITPITPVPPPAPGAGDLRPAPDTLPPLPPSGAGAGGGAEPAPVAPPSGPPPVVVIPEAPRY